MPAKDHGWEKWESREEPESWRPRRVGAGALEERPGGRCFLQQGEKERALVFLSPPLVAHICLPLLETKRKPAGKKSGE